MKQQLLNVNMVFIERIFKAVTGALSVCNTLKQVNAMGSFYIKHLWHSWPRSLTWHEYKLTFTACLGILLNVILLTSLFHNSKRGHRFLVTFAGSLFAVDLILLPFSSSLWPLTYFMDHSVLNIDEYCNERVIGLNVWILVFWSLLYLFSPPHNSLKSKRLPKKVKLSTKAFDALKIRILSYKVFLTYLCVCRVVSAFEQLILSDVESPEHYSHLDTRLIAILTFGCVLNMILLVAMLYNWEMAFNIIFAFFGCCSVLSSLISVKVMTSSAEAFWRFREMSFILMVDFSYPIRHYVEGEFQQKLIDAIAHAVYWFMIFECSLYQGQDSQISKTFKKHKQKDHEPSSQWFFHCCLYGHKDMIKQMMENRVKRHKIGLLINRPLIHGFRPIHLAVWCGHLTTAQVLLSKFSKEIDLSLVNDDGHNCLDMALLQRDNSMIKLILKHGKPKICSMIHAVKTRQYVFVAHLHKIFKNALQQHQFLNISIQRFTELCKEVELRSTTKDRKEVCERNLQIFEKAICQQISTLFCSGTISKKKEILEKPTTDDIDVEEDTEQKEIKATEDLDIDKIVEEYSCPVCFFVMKPPERRIYACSNDHWICSQCLLKSDKIKTCPICREDFDVNAPKVRVTSERCLAIMLKSLDIKDQ